jgi:hypothetical protein
MRSPRWRTPTLHAGGRQPDYDAVVTNTRAVE